MLRIVLGTQLRRLREAGGITREAAGDTIRASHAKISRLELGRIGFKVRDVADLLLLYGVTDERERDSFLTLTQRANTPGWWHEYSDLLPSWFETYLGLEQASSVVRLYQTQFVPGLLQTEDFARAVIQLGHPPSPLTRSTAVSRSGWNVRTFSPNRRHVTCGPCWTRRHFGGRWAAGGSCAHSSGI